MWNKLYISDGRIKFALFYLTLLGGLSLALMLSPSSERRTVYQPAYLSTCLLMGAALGLDVMCATVGRFRCLNTWSKRLMWCYRSAAGHTICPLAGVLVCFWFASFFGAMERIIGLAGFLLIAYIYGMELRDVLLPETEGLEESAEERAIPAVLGREWALVFGVSLDSLLSGPAQSTQRVGWTLLQSAGSFLIVGLFVGLLGVTAAFIACRLLALTERVGAQSAQILARMQIAGLFLELSVIAYFGWDALLNFGLGLNVSWIGAAICSVATSCVFFGALGRRLWTHQINEARKAVGGI